MKLYGISGLGADQRVFQHLNLSYPIIPIHWTEVQKNENFSDYAKVLTKQIDTSEAYGIIAVSFGGLVAVEMNKFLNPEFIVLVSSAETKNDLRAIYRLIGKIGVIKLMPAFLFDPPRFLAHWIFNSKNKNLLSAILDDTNSQFAKWSVGSLVNWNNTVPLNIPVLKIEGEIDKLIPATNNEDSHVIKQGGHFMIVDRAEEISEIINSWLSKRF